MENKEFNLEEFMKPRCPVKIGDSFFQNYHVPSKLLLWEVTDIQEVNNEHGFFYAVTAICPNIAVGTAVKVFSSRFIEDNCTVVRKGEK